MFTREVERLAAPLVAAYARKTDPWEAFKAGVPGFPGRVSRPRRAADRSARRPLTAIGWEQVRRLESPLLEMMELGITRAIEAGRIAPRPPDPLASFLYGALCETAMIVARADDQKVAHRQAAR